MKKISPVIIVGLVLTIVAFSLYISGPAFVRDISDKAYDAFIRYASEDPKSERVAIVDLDDRTLSNPAYGQWPWPRYLVAELTQKILDAGATVVAFDVLFSEGDRTSPLALQNRINEYFKIHAQIDGVPPEYRDFDQIFGNVLKKGKTILGCCMIPSDKAVADINEQIDPSYQDQVLLIMKGEGSVDDLARDNLMQASGMLVAIPTLSKVSRNAFFNAVTDSDSIVRNNPLIWQYGRRTYPSLALQAIMLDQDIKKVRVLLQKEGGVESLSLKDVEIPTDSHGRLVVNYRKLRKDSGESGFRSSFPTWSACDVLSGKVGTNELEGMIVFVGSSATGLKDVKATPLTQFFSGVEVHATMVDNILGGDMLRNPSWMIGANAIAILFVGIFLSVFISRGRSWISFLVSIGIIYVSIQACPIIVKQYHMVFVPVWVVLTVILIYPILTMLKFWEEELQKKKVRDMFGTMVSKEVLHFLENHPGSFSLSGQKRDATMFFSDVAGFTTISESLEPSKLSELLNRYLSPMSDIIMDRDGYVDKYEGDAIMAVWGVPYPMKDHAVQACFAALEQQAKLAELRPILKKEFGHDIHIRIGINSGIVTAGNMGSDRKLQYTVLGDPVNQAARFEPANKDYGTLIIIGETTYDEAGDQIEARLMDRLVVKGKTQPIRIYELLGKKGEISGQKAKLVELYVQGLRLHWERRWDEAIASLDAALKLDPGDGPSATMRNRIVSYKSSPPSEGWAGEFVRYSKD